MAVIQTKKEDSKYDYLKKVYKEEDQKLKSTTTKSKGKKTLVKKVEPEKIAKKDWMTLLAIFLVLLILSASGYLIAKYW